jgi:S1-C subfamily serine protease
LKLACFNKVVFVFFLLGSLIACASHDVGVSSPLSEEAIARNLEKPLYELRDKGQWEELIARLEQFKHRYPRDYRFEDLYTQATLGLQEQRIDLWEKGSFREALEKGESLESLGVALQPSQTRVLAQYLASLETTSLGQARAIAFYYRNKGYTLPPQFRIEDETRQPQNSSTWLKGTLTLIVDQGVRMQSGMGIPTRSLGSAFVIDPQGYALTNYHVISTEVDKKYKGFSRLYARLPGGRGERLKADVIGFNKDLDLALIKVHFPVEYSFNLWNDREDAMRVGQSVFALGSPLGLEQTITSGIISAKNRTLLPIGDAFQLDAAINQGNSGGPVINPQGDVLGMAFAGIPGFEGLNFAIPAVWLRLYLPFLYEAGPTYNAWLGAAISESFSGLQVIHTVRSSPTDGLLRPGDRLIAINGRRLNSIVDYQREILTSRSLMRLHWQRDDKILSALVLPQERPEEPLVTIFKRSSQQEFLNLILGVTLEAGKKSRFYRQYRASHVFPHLIGDEIGINENDQLEVYRVKMERGGEFFSLAFLIRRQAMGFFETPIGIHLPPIYPYFI